MAVIATSLVEFAGNGNSKTLIAPGHTALKPKVIIQKRVVAQGNTSSPSDTIDVIFGTTDTAGAVLPAKVNFGVTVKRPVLGQAADVTSALALFREIVASDEFAATVTGQTWIK